MRPKSLMLLVLALGCGLVASIGISQVMDRNAKGNVAAVETKPIYVAAHNINLGDPIDASLVSLQDWPKDKVPPGAISQLEDLKGRRPRAAIVQGEPILDAKLLAPGQLADPITAIPKGYRLKTISVDAEKSAAGLLSPGDRVDVSLFVKKDDHNGIDSAKTKVILQNIRVFAVDQTVQRSPEGGDERTIAKTVSLLLTPAQASKLTLAENLGQVSLIPRNPDDEEAADASEFSTDDLLVDGGKGSRHEEQGKGTEDSQKDVKSSNKDLLTAIQQHVPPAKPPFHMEIVEAQDVREVLFDPETGKPLHDQNLNGGNHGANSGPGSSSSSAGAPNDAGSNAAPADGGSDAPADFPINLDSPK